MFYGLPGTGKTSVIKAIATKLNYNIAKLSLSSPTLTDGGLGRIFNEIPEKSILVVEEIDAAFTKRDVINNIYAKTNTHNTITFAGFLDLIDGLADLNNQIIIMTTNHIELLDAAQIRPGRIDYKLEFTYMTDETVGCMIKSFYEEVTEKELQTICNYISNITPAKLQEVMVLYHEKSISDIINDLQNKKLILRFEKVVNDNSSKMFN